MTKLEKKKKQPMDIKKRLKRLMTPAGFLIILMGLGSFVYGMSALFVYENAEGYLGIYLGVCFILVVGLMIFS